MDIWLFLFRFDWYKSEFALTLFIIIFFFTQVYNLVQQGLLKKLQCTVQRISSLALHPGGDNLIVGSEDRRVCWFDMDLSTKPYKTIKCVDYFFLSSVFYFSFSNHPFIELFSLIFVLDSLLF